MRRKRTTKRTLKRMGKMQVCEGAGRAVFVSDSRERMESSHFHPFYEIYYFLGDEMTYFLEDTALSLQKHDFIFVKKYSYHKTFYPDKADCRRMNIAFDELLFRQVGLEEEMEGLLAPFKETTRIRFAQQQDREYLHRLFYAAFQDFEKRRPCWRVKLCAAILELAALLPAMDPYDARVGQNKTQSFVAQAIAYLNANYRNHISLDEMSAGLYVSKYHLCRSFKEITGTGINRYMIEKRLNEAQRLLLTTDWPVAEICGECGFDSMSNFLEHFKRQYGCSPRDFRAQAGEGRFLHR